MSLPSQPLSPEEPEQQSTFPSSIDETLTASSTTSDTLAEQREQHSADTASEDLPAHTETPSVLEDLPAHTETPSVLEDLPAHTETPSVLNENISSIPDENMDSIPDEEEDEEEEEEEKQKGVFIQRGWLIAAASVVVVAALLATFLLLLNHPQDPPTDWIASYTPPANSSNATKILYYLRWTNQNSDLKGQMQLAANANGTPQSLTVPVIGLYNAENHIIYIVITINGQTDTLTGTINNDILILNQANAPNALNQLVFHPGNASEYQQATKKLNSGSK